MYSVYVCCITAKLKDSIENIFRIRKHFPCNNFTYTLRLDHKETGRPTLQKVSGPPQRNDPSVKESRHGNSTTDRTEDSTLRLLRRPLRYRRAAQRHRLPVPG